MYYISLAQNQLTGTLPRILERASLSYVAFHDNKLTGQLPDSWCGVGAPTEKLYCCLVGMISVFR